jgi:hypothetical protein
MGVMDWSSTAMAAKYQHVIDAAKKRLRGWTARRLRPEIHADGRVQLRRSRNN